MKGKIINDPIYGFLNFRNELLPDIIEHTYFQRLRRIRQMGMAHYVYPGAVHTRFQHSLGAAHLMGLAMQSLIAKGNEIDRDIILSAQAAILLHDIGHGPFSHALEQCIIDNMHHEDLSLLLMRKINNDVNNRLEDAIKIFEGSHPIRFLNQLVSGQLDMDRMDYLNRDSFFSGVSEGVIGYDRILQMIDVHEGNLVVEAKGIHSIEKFLIARRLMYWQVYLHKAVLGTEQLLIQIMKRAKVLAKQKVNLFATPAFGFFLYEDIDKYHFTNSDEAIDKFAALDDIDITASIKVWQHHEDQILARLCQMLIQRKLFKLTLSSDDLSKKREEISKKIQASGQYSNEEIGYFLLHGIAGNDTYNYEEQIKILFKDGTTKDITEIENTLITKDLARPIQKHFIAIIPEWADYLNN